MTFPGSEWLALQIEFHPDPREFAEWVALGLYYHCYESPTIEAVCVHYGLTVWFVDGADLNAEAGVQGRSVGNAILVDRLSEIWVRKGLVEFERVRSLAHELAHRLLARYLAELPRTKNYTETWADTFANVVAVEWFGLMELAA